jgi:hypothetical protein
LYILATTKSRSLRECKLVEHSERVQSIRVLPENQTKDLIADEQCQDTRGPCEFGGGGWRKVTRYLILPTPELP